MNYAYN